MKELGHTYECVRDGAIYERHCAHRCVFVLDGVNNVIDRALKLTELCFFFPM